MTLEQAIAVVGFLLGVGTTLVSIVSWYSSSVKKRYAAERDFNHLRNNQAQIQQGIDHLCEEMDEKFSEVNKQLIEMKAYMIRSLGENTTGGKL